MKIVLLNPEIDAQHQFVGALTQAGHALLFAQDENELQQILKLHSGSVDVAMVHREAGSIDGIQVVERLRGSSDFSELPILVTTTQWTAEQCEEHQQSANGANAYLAWPVEASIVESVLAQIFNPEAEAPVIQNEPLVQNDLDPPTAFLGAADESSIVLVETPTAPPEMHSGTAPSIHLEIEPPTPSESAFTQTIPTAVFSDPVDMPPIPLMSEAPAFPNFEIQADVEIQVGEVSSPIVESVIPTLPPDEASRELPYLFEGGAAQAVSLGVEPSGSTSEASVAISPPSSGSPDVETLKSYLLMREQDVSALSHQVKSLKDQLKHVSEEMMLEKARISELKYEIEQRDRKISSFDQDVKQNEDRLKAEIRELQFQLKVRDDKIKVVEAQGQLSGEELERLRERVRNDIRKIRVREKELENRLELLKKDSEALVNSREAKIIELKRKLDLLEFNTDLLQDQLSKEKERTRKYQTQLEKAAQIVRVAGGLLGPSDTLAPSPADLAPLAPDMSGRKVS